jgi:hypothetical protein
MYAAGQEWFHISRVPGGAHVHKMDQEKLAGLARELMSQGRHEDADQAIAEALGMFAEAIRTQLGFPQDWMNSAEYDSRITPGEPHPSLMAIATLHDDLPEVN